MDWAIRCGEYDEQIEISLKPGGKAGTSSAVRRLRKQKRHVEGWITLLAGDSRVRPLRAPPPPPPGKLPLSCVGWPLHD